MKTILRPKDKTIMKTKKTQYIAAIEQANTILMDMFEELKDGNQTITIRLLANDMCEGEDVVGKVQKVWRRMKRFSILQKNGEIYESSFTSLCKYPFSDEELTFYSEGNC